MNIPNDTPTDFPKLPEGQTLEEALDTLSVREAQVLFWKLEGENHEHIGNRFERSAEWTEARMRSVYGKLGLGAKEIHRLQKNRLLQKYYRRPFLAKINHDYHSIPDVFGIKADPDEIKDDPEKIKDGIKAREEERDKSPTPPPTPTPDRPAPEPTPPFVRDWVNWAVGIGCVGIVLFLFLGGGLLFLRGFLPGLIPAIPTIPEATEPIETAPTRNDATLSPTSAEPSPTRPTNTPRLTDTPPATSTPQITNTPKLFYEQGENVEIESGVLLSLKPDFLHVTGCNRLDNGWGVYFEVFNRSGNQFLIRLNTGAFSAVDDLGNTYTLRKAGVHYSVPWCGDPLGIDVNFEQLHNSIAAIGLQFEGQAPLEATHYLITVENISGEGPLVFKKDL